MRKIVVTEFMTLDGVIENPAWPMPYWNDEIAQFKGEEQAATDALLLGRVTYEGFAASWPGRTDPGAEALCQACADLNLDSGFRQLQRLNIRVGNEELNAV